MYTLKEMKEKSLEFYKGLNVETSQENILLAVRSLTMPQYAKEYKDKYGETIGELFAKECFPTDDTIMTVAVGKAILESEGEYQNLGARAICSYIFLVKKI